MKEGEKEMSVLEKLAIIQTKFKSKKSRYNSFGNYNFRSAEDILEAIKPFLLELNVTVTVNEEIIGFSDGLPMIKSIAKIQDFDGNFEEATAIVGVDLAQKKMQVPQQFGSASSYGKKYSLGNLFLIDDTADSDAGNDHSDNRLRMDAAALAGAIKFVSDGGDITKISAKYRMSKAQELQIKSAVKNG